MVPCSGGTIAILLVCWPCILPLYSWGCKLIGLLDVLGDVDGFVQAGGWLQPVTTLLPASFGILLQRWAINAIAYGMSTATVGTGILTAKSASNSGKSGGRSTLQKSVSTSSSAVDDDPFQDSIQSALLVSAVFVLFRLLLELAAYNALTVPTPTEFAPTAASLSSGPFVWAGLEPALVVRLVQMARECYTVTLTTVTGRYLYYTLGLDRYP